MFSYKSSWAVQLLGIFSLWAALFGQAWAANATLSPTSLNITTSTTANSMLSGNDSLSVRTFKWTIPAGLGVTPGALTNATYALTSTSLTITTKALGAFSAEIIFSSGVPGTYTFSNTQAGISFSPRNVTVNVTGPSVQNASLSTASVNVGLTWSGEVVLSGNDGMFSGKTFTWSIPSGLKVTAGGADNATYSISSSSLTIRTSGKGSFTAPFLISATRTGSFTMTNSRADFPLNPKNIAVTATNTPPGPQTRSFTLQVAEANWTLRPNMTQAGFWLVGGTLPGREIRVNQGDTVKITFINKHTQAHALKFRNGLMVTGDGAMIAPNASFNYEFVANQPGTYYYTGEDAIAIDRGMYGAIVVKSPLEPAVYHDIVHFWDEIPRDWANVNHPFPTYNTHEFVINGKTMDSKVSGNNVVTNAVHGKVGQRSLVRLISIGAHTHAPHLHGHLNDITEGNNPLGPQIPTDVAQSPPGSVQHHYINARAAGTWMYHCHVETHLLNNTDGDYPGGMFTHVEVDP